MFYFLLSLWIPPGTCHERWSADGPRAVCRSKISNQFRALDEDEIGFLEEVEQRKREQEERVRRETEEGLRLFREARRGEAAELEKDVDGVGESGGWKVGGKRKRRKGEIEGGGVGLLKGFKKRSSSSGNGGKDGDEDGKDEEDSQRQGKAVEKVEPPARKEGAPVSAAKTPAVTAAAPKLKLGLVDYGSDDDSE